MFRIDDLPARPPRPSAPQVSVVVPTCRRVDLLHRCLEALRRQLLPAAEFEVLVVDDGRDDATRAAVAAFARRCPELTLRYLRPARRRGPAAARNLGWQQARAPLIAFTDDDTIPAPDWLLSGVAAMRTLALPALGGRVVVPLSADRRMSDHERMTWGLQHTEFVTANAFVRRDALQAVGGFDERFERPWREDSDLQFRIERELGPVGRCEQAIVSHPVRPERFGVSLRQQKNALYDALLYSKHPLEYRRRIRRTPPWAYYVVVGATLLGITCALAGLGGPAWGLGGMALALVGRFAAQRLRQGLLTLRHVAEMLWTSALIPFLSVYWRLRGAWRFRVWFF
ncbi:glycosyltransferase family 2 protein [Caldimonas sp. KR1-144]|uniref:glycosyltransferase family 2 protein n=1 Tax=Caldimonas sp. KR1-144 TaxID=3400911 RepID=UPI003C03999C